MRARKGPLEETLAALRRVRERPADEASRAELRRVLQGEGRDTAGQQTFVASFLDKSDALAEAAGVALGESRSPEGFALLRD